MATIVMREILAGEVPKDGGTAIQEDPGRPVFRGNGPNDYVCVQCGNLLAEAMDPAYMSKRVRSLWPLQDGQRRGRGRVAGSPSPRILSSIALWRTYAAAPSPSGAATRTSGGYPIAGVARSRSES
jgi:hypothetical protein